MQVSSWANQQLSSSIHCLVGPSSQVGRRRATPLVPAAPGCDTSPPTSKTDRPGKAITTRNKSYTTNKTTIYLNSFKRHHGGQILVLPHNIFTQVSTQQPRLPV